jgi:hypothetical protein
MCFTSTRMNICADDHSCLFTASQALKVCDFIKDSLRIKELDKPLPPRPIGYDSGATDRWKNLPSAFVTHWSSHRMTSPTFFIRLLR